MTRSWLKSLVSFPSLSLTQCSRFIIKRLPPLIREQSLSVIRFISSFITAEFYSSRERERESDCCFSLVTVKVTLTFAGVTEATVTGYSDAHRTPLLCLCCLCTLCDLFFSLQYTCWKCCLFALLCNDDDDDDDDECTRSAFHPHHSQWPFLSCDSTQSGGIFSFYLLSRISDSFLVWCHKLHMPNAWEKERTERVREWEARGGQDTHAPLSPSLSLTVSRYLRGRLFIISHSWGR